MRPESRERPGDQPPLRQLGGINKADNGRVAGRAEGSAVAAKVKAALA